MINIQIGDAEEQLLNDLGIRAFGGSNQGRIRAGSVLKTRPGTHVEGYSRHSGGTLIQLGMFSYASANAAPITMLAGGRYCSIAAGVRILDGHHPMTAVTTNPYHYGRFYRAPNIPEDYCYAGERPAFPESYGPIRLGHDVWVGAHCTIRAGLKIGHGAVIAGGANVVSDVPPYAVVGGNPARVIKYRFPEELRERLLALEWWDVSPAVLRSMNMYDPEAFCTALEAQNASGQLPPFQPPVLVVTRDGQLRRK